MLIAMLTWYLLGGSLTGGALLTPADIDLLEIRVESEIADSARRVQALEILENIETESEEFNRLFFQSGNELNELYLDHDARSYQMRRSLEQLNTEWYLSQQRNLGFRDQLKQTITVEEWTQIFVVP